VEDWSDEKIHALVVEADSYWEEYRFSKKASGLLAFAHLMKPQAYAVTLRLAATFAMRGRDLEATRLGDFAMRNMRDPKTLESESLKSYLKILSWSFRRTGNHRMALRLATYAGDDKEIKQAKRLQTLARRARSIAFPKGAIADALRDEYHSDASGGKLFCVQKTPELYRSVNPAGIAWIRSEEDIQELTPDKLGVLADVPSFVCSSEYLRQRLLARLPFIGEDNVNVILEAPLVSPEAKTAREAPPVVMYCGDLKGKKSLKEAFPHHLVVTRDDEPYELNQAQIFILYTETPSTRDIEDLIRAQANGVIPVCTAIGAIPEYMVGGILVKPRDNIGPLFDPEHLKALCNAAVKQVNAPLSERQHVATEAHNHFSARNGALRWLELINRVAN